VELVKDKKTKEPLPRRVTERIFGECVKRGLLTMAYSASFRIQPALTIDEATAKKALLTHPLIAQYELSEELLERLALEAVAA